MSNLEKLGLNKAGVNQLLRSAETRSMIASFGQDVMNKAGAGYKMNVNYSSKDGRVSAYVYPEKDEAKQDNLENNTALKAVGGSHG